MSRTGLDFTLQERRMLITVLDFAEKQGVDLWEAAKNIAPIMKREPQEVHDEMIDLSKDRSLMLEFMIGRTVDVEVNQVVPYGAFCHLLHDPSLSALLHVSEFTKSGERIDDPNKYVKVGDRLRAKVIRTKNGRVGFSVKVTNPLRPKYGIDTNPQYNDSPNGASDGHKTRRGFGVLGGIFGR